jgi:hypothetical protein
MEKAISAIRQTGAEMGLPYLIGLYAEALCDSGRRDEARTTIEAALELGRYNGTYFQLSELLRIEALIHGRSSGPAGEIEQMLTKAAEVAALQHSAIGQLRVAIDLAKHLRKQGEGGRAREILARHTDLLRKLNGGGIARSTGAVD